MYKLIATAALFAGLALPADTTKPAAAPAPVQASAQASAQAPAIKPKAAPKPIPADRQEQVSRTMINLQRLQINYLQIQQQYAQLGEQLKDASAKWDAELDGLRKEFGAAGCNLVEDKTWSCPEATPAADSVTKTTK